LRAIVAERFGGPEVLKAAEVDRPSPGPGDVLVRVMVSGTNPVDVQLLRDGRLAKLEPPFVSGHDVSGIVEVLGNWTSASTKRR
jgi:NADPH2:quinone reductase